MTTAAPRLRDVALPTEHGGWSLTIEPVLLGLVAAPSVAGVALGCGALIAFTVRTPLKIALVDRFRRRRLARTDLAVRLALVELAVLAVLSAFALVRSESAFWWPIVAAVPLVLVGLWYDARSRSRRLVPELAGSVGIASVAAAIALAGGFAKPIAFGLWLIAGARAIAAIPFVRVQLRRSKGRPHRSVESDSAQAVAALGIVAGAATGVVSVPGATAVVVLAAVHLVQVRLRPPTAPLLGAQQTVLGLGVVLTAALGALAP